MHRRTFWLFVGGFSFFVTAYLMWAAMPLMRPRLIFSKDVPNEARTSIQQWRNTSKMLDPEPSVSGYLGSLVTPLEFKPDWLNVEMDSPVRASIGYGSGSISFERDSRGNWNGLFHGCSGTWPVP